MLFIYHRKTKKIFINENLFFYYLRCMMFIAVIYKTTSKFNYASMNLNTHIDFGTSSNFYKKT